MDSGEPRAEFRAQTICRYLLMQRFLALLLEALRAGVLVSNAGKYPIHSTSRIYSIAAVNAACTWAAHAVCQRMLATELAERLRGTRIESAACSGVTRTSCFRNARGLPGRRAFGRARGAWFAQSHPRAAEHPCSWLAIRRNRINGRFYGPGRKPLAVPARARDAHRRAALWSASAELVREYAHDSSAAV